MLAPTLTQEQIQAAHTARQMRRIARTIQMLDLPTADTAIVQSLWYTLEMLHARLRKEEGLDP